LCAIARLQQTRDQLAEAQTRVDTISAEVRMVPCLYASVVIPQSFEWVPLAIAETASCAAGTLMRMHCQVDAALTYVLPLVLLLPLAPPLLLLLLLPCAAAADDVGLF
jgi:hypothetical protein